MLQLCKLALRISTDAYDTLLQMLIQSALQDMAIPGINIPENEIDYSAVLKQCIITYVRLHFGEPDNYDKLAEAYSEQKKQLQMCSDYNIWGDDEE